MKKAVHHNLITFLENKNLLTDCQYRFRSKRSTKLATTLFCDTIRKEISNGNLVGSVYIDLSKAFNTISHSMLIEKLQTYGVKGDELVWFIDYLFGRSQIVAMNNVKSNKEPIYCGVPQGSILGPLLFIVFYNDFADHLEYCNAITYTDDTVIFVSDKNVSNIETKLNKDLDKISAYFHLNELVINLKKGKSEVMLFGSSQRLKKDGNLLNVIYEGNKINFVTQYNYLGTIIDNHLNLNENFNRQYKRASARLRLLERLRPYLTVDATIKVYLSMIVPIMTYSSTIRIPCNGTQCKKTSIA